MFKTFRVAAIAAAAALSCASPTAAAAEFGQVSLAARAAPAPISAVGDAPLVNAERAVLTTLPAPVAETASADGAPTPAAEPSRVRPDRLLASPTPLPTPNQGVTGHAGRPLVELVAEHARSETGDEQFECLARAVYFESRGEPLEGQLAVAEVILNRVASGRFRATICDVVRQPSQFSFVRRGVIPEAPRESAAWQRAVAVAHIALQNLHDVTGENSLFFHATYVNPGWGRPRIARIGNHIFYR